VCAYLTTLFDEKVEDIIVHTYRMNVPMGNFIEIKLPMGMYITIHSSN